MLLAIDAGNTNVVFAVADGGRIAGTWRISTDTRRTADEYAVWLMQLLSIRGVDRREIKQIIVSTVVPRALHNLDVLARNFFNIEPMIAGQPPVDYAIDIDVDEPRSLGADRAVNAIAAHARHGGDLIIVDFGTATTFDAIDFNGAYKGGIIAPGINLSLDALVGNTAMLPRIAIDVPETSSVIGRNTVGAIQSGLVYGYVSLVEGVLRRIRAEVDWPCLVVGTGGFATTVAQESECIDLVDGTLVLEGLRIVHARNRGKSAR